VTTDERERDPGIAVGKREIDGGEIGNICGG